MIEPKQLLVEIIRPTLYALELPGQAAEALVLGTAMAESGCGTYLRQLGGGPALGIYQMEPATHDDLWKNWLRYRPELTDRVERMLGAYPTEKSAALIGNLYYATAMCRLHYRRQPQPLPAWDDAEGLAKYWKKYYNTHLGKGTVRKATLYFGHAIGVLRG